MGGAPQPGTRAEVGEQQAQETPDPSFSTSFGAPSDVSDAIEGGSSSVSQLPSPGGDRSESPTNRIPLGVKSPSLLNTQQPSELRRRPTLGNTVRKRGAQFDDENSDETKSKRPYLGYIARKVLGYEEVRKEVREEVRRKEVRRKEVRRKEVRRKEVRRKEVRKPEAHFDDEFCDLPKPKRVCSSFVARVGV